MLFPYIIQNNIMKHIAILGYMGSGKSIISNYLSKATNKIKISIDEEIENVCKRPISEIFTQFGEFYFRNEERKIIRHIVVSSENLILDLGGGAPCFFDTMKFLNQHCTTVYLNTPVDQLIKRLKDDQANRPLLKNKEEQELEDFIRKQFEERKKYYQKADYTINTANKSIEKIVEEIMGKVNE